MTSWDPAHVAPTAMTCVHGKVYMSGPIVCPKNFFLVAILVAYSDK